MNSTENKESFNNISAKIQEIENEENRTIKLKLILLSVFCCMTVGILYLFFFTDPNTDTADLNVPSQKSSQYAKNSVENQYIERGNAALVDEDNMPTENVVIRQILPEESSSSEESIEDPISENSEESDFKNSNLNTDTTLELSGNDSYHNGSTRSKQDIDNETTVKEPSNKQDSFPTFKDWLNAKMQDID